MSIEQSPHNEKWVVEQYDPTRHLIGVELVKQSTHVTKVLGERSFIKINLGSSEFDFLVLINYLAEVINFGKNDPIDIPVGVFNKSKLSQNGLLSFYIGYKPDNAQLLKQEILDEPTTHTSSYQEIKTYFSQYYSEFKNIDEVIDLLSQSMLSQEERDFIISTMVPQLFYNKISSLLIDNKIDKALSEADRLHTLGLLNDTYYVKIISFKNLFKSDERIKQEALQSVKQIVLEVFQSIYRSGNHELIEIFRSSITQVLHSTDNYTRFDHLKKFARSQRTLNIFSQENARLLETQLEKIDESTLKMLLNDLLISTIQVSYPLGHDNRVSRAKQNGVIDFNYDGLTLNCDGFFSDVPQKIQYFLLTRNADNTLVAHFGVRVIYSNMYFMDSFKRKTEIQLNEELIRACGLHRKPGTSFASFFEIPYNSLHFRKIVDLILKKGAPISLIEKYGNLELSSIWSEEDRNILRENNKVDFYIN